MLNHQSTQIGLLSWGAIFCLIAAICIFMSKYTDKQKQKWMLCMEFSTSLLLINDALTWIFQGTPGRFSYYMVRISNFLVFAITDIILLFFHLYVCSSIRTDKEKPQNVRIKMGKILPFIGTFLVILSQFTGLYYSFDANNDYHRSPAYILSLLIPFVCMLSDFSLIIHYRNDLSKKVFFSMISYVILPLLGCIIQFFNYGASLVNIAIGISMLLMYIAIIDEQNHVLDELAKSRQETAAKLEISTMLNHCVTELSSNIDIDLAIQKLLMIINDYFQADRTYIFENDRKRNITQNTYEYVKGQVSSQKDNLQAIPLEVIGPWMQTFEKFLPYYIPDLELEQGAPFYEVLKEQDIHRLLAVPLIEGNEVLGFLGVDNPENHYEDATLLSSLQYFVANSLHRKKDEAYLKFLSYRDMLTMLYNRNKYIEILDDGMNRKVNQTGVAYIDLNGLKKINDQQGHEAGDIRIRGAARIIWDIFPEHAYRIGGDEFVVIVPEISEAEFEQKMQKLRDVMLKNEVSVSIGSVYGEKEENLEQMLKEADQKMYVEKKQYHQRRFS